MVRPVLPGFTSSSIHLSLPPTLLIVGGKDDTVCGLNLEIENQLRAQKKKLVIIPGGTHLFDEPRGALEEVARLSTSSTATEEVTILIEGRRASFGFSEYIRAGAPSRRPRPAENLSRRAAI
jgi:acetyl esterase/lipase